MSMDSLEIAPRTAGRASRQVEVAFVRELGQADLALLASERGTQAPAVVRLRDRHHALARCLAAGMSPGECSSITGYSPSRISILQADESFRELVQHYRLVKESAFASFHDRAQTTAIAAVDIVAERLEDNPEDISTGQALEIIKTLADRSGNAPVTKNINVNVNQDLGTKLQAAQARVEAARRARIEGPPPEEGDT